MRHRKRATTRKPAEFAPKKRPVQARSLETFNALIDACTWLLPRLGYAKTTTNRIAERAGVNIASLYEYFPGKDAIVAQVAERLVERVLTHLERMAPTIRLSDEHGAVREWIDLVYETVARERALVAVFASEISFTNHLPSVRALGPRLLAFSLQLQERSGDFVRADFSPAALQLLINLVQSTIMQLVLDPPESISQRALLDELSLRMATWIRPSPPFERMERAAEFAE